MKLAQVLVAVVLLLSLITFAQDRSKLPPIGVTNVIEFALSAHPQAAIARESIELAKQNVNSAKGEFKPNASASYNFSANRNPVAIGLRGDANIGFGGFSVNQSILNVPAIRSYKAAKTRLNASISSAQGEGLRIAGVAAGTFIDVLKLRITLDLAAENYYFIQALVESMKNGDLSGRASQSDVTLAAGALGSALNEKHIWMAESEVSENDFVRDTHLTAKDYFLVLPDVLRLPETDDDAIKIAMEKNPQFQAAKLQAEAAVKDISAAKSTRLPRVDAFANGYNVDRQSKDLGPFAMGGWSAGVSVSYPLFDGKRGAQIAATQIKQNIAALQVVDQSVNMSTSLKNIYVRNRERQVSLKGLCETVKSRVWTVDDMTKNLLTKYTVQDLLFQKQELVKAAVSLNNELLTDVLDSYNVHIQMGTLMENLPAPVDPGVPPGPNPHHKGKDSYTGLISICEERGLL